jgi:hypothetical protein
MRVSLSRGTLQRAALVPLSMLALFLAGCFSITNQTTTQVDGVGDLVVTTETCAQNPFPAGPCEAGFSQDATADSQNFVAYVIDDWLVAPATISWNGTLGSFTLARSDAFANALAAKLSAGAGKRWVAYQSARMPRLHASTEYRMTAVARFGVPNAAPSTASLATATGWRMVRDAASGVTAMPIDRPINCAEVDPEATAQPATTCAFSILPAVQPTTPDLPANLSPIELNTLTLTPPPAATDVVAGASATLTFGVQAHRAPAGPATVPAAATTTLTGATLTAPATLALAGAGTSVVQVQTPANAAPGDYTVRLVGAGGARSATATLRVVAPAATPTPAPTATPVTLSAQTSTKSLQQAVNELAALLKNQAKVDGIRRSNVFDLPIAAPAAGTLTVTLDGSTRARGKKRTVLLAKGTRTVTNPGLTVVKLTPTKAGARTLTAKGRYKGTLRVQFSGSAAQTAKPVAVSFG